MKLFGQMIRKKLKLHNPHKYQGNLSFLLFTAIGKMNDEQKSQLSVKSLQ